MRRAAPKKKIDIATHDFDSESLEERILSLYSAVEITDELYQDLNIRTQQEALSDMDIKFKYKDEIDFIKMAIRTAFFYDRNEAITTINNSWSELVAKKRQLKIDSII